MRGVNPPSATRPHRPSDCFAIPQIRFNTFCLFLLFFSYRIWGRQEGAFGDLRRAKEYVRHLRAGEKTRHLRSSVRHPPGLKPLLRSSKPCGLLRKALSIIPLRGTSARRGKSPASSISAGSGKKVWWSPGRESSDSARYKIEKRTPRGALCDLYKP